VVDLGGDGKKEIIRGGVWGASGGGCSMNLDGYLEAYRPDLTLIWKSVAVGSSTFVDMMDVDGDGYKDIGLDVLWGRTDTCSGSGRDIRSFVILNGFNGSRFLFEQKDVAVTAFRTGNLDGDGVKDIVTWTQVVDTGGSCSSMDDMHIFLFNGTGWEHFLEMDLRSINGTWSCAGFLAPILKDINNDGIDEIITVVMLSDGSSIGVTRIVVVR